MPYITQSRALKQRPAIYTWRLDTQKATTGFVDTDAFFGMGSETTYSYRSVRRNDSASEDREHMTGEQIRRQFRHEYQTRYDNGHEFWTEKRYIGFETPSVSIRAIDKTSLWNSYSGFMTLDNYSGVGYWPPFSAPETTKIIADGSSAVAKTIPTNPNADLALMLSELLREGLPSIIGSQVLRRRATTKDIGGEYLNIEFGIKPLLSDLRSVWQSLSNASAVIRQFERDSGRQVRRRLTLRDGTTASDVGKVTSFPLMGTGYSSIYRNALFSQRSAATTIIDNLDEKVVFSGAYTYNAHQNLTNSQLLNNIAGYEQRANKLLGTRLTPSLIYNMAPWTWMLDWFVNIGDFVHNVSAFSQDSLVLKYGYIMHETHAKRTFYSDKALAWNSRPLILSRTSHIHRKSRTRATPYGFGLKLENFNPRQWAILAALGLTKGPSQSLRVT